MGQDVESYFQEVLATAEQSAEEGSRGEGGAFGGRLQQLYSEIVGEIDAGKGRGRAKSRSCCLKAQRTSVFVRAESHRGGNVGVALHFVGLHTVKTVI